jgi:hypothetical protein
MAFAARLIMLVPILLIILVLLVALVGGLVVAKRRLVDHEVPPDVRPEDRRPEGIGLV